MSLRVLQILPELESGGVERGTVEVAEALIKQGHQAFVVSAGGRMVRKLHAIGAIHYQLAVGKKSIFSIRHCIALKNFIIANRINIIDVRSRFPGWITWLTLKFIKQPIKPVLITSVHGAYSVNSYSAIMLRGDRIVAVSEFIKRYILENYPWVNKGKIIVIPRGVSTNEYYPSYQPDSEWLENWKHQHPELENKFIITLIGRITQIKGQDQFISIIKKLIDQGHDHIHGLLVGGASKNKTQELERLRLLVAKNNLEKHISFLGSRDDAREIICMSNVILSLTKKPESFGRTIVEALALGKPVLAYDHGGANEILKRCYPAGLVNLFDNDALCKKIASLFSDNEIVVKQIPYTKNMMLEQTIALYQSMLDHE